MLPLEQRLWVQLGYRGFKKKFSGSYSWVEINIQYWMKWGEMWLLAMPLKWIYTKSCSVSEVATVEFHSLTTTSSLLTSPHTPLHFHDLQSIDQAFFAEGLSPFLVLACLLDSLLYFGFTCSAVSGGCLFLHPCLYLSSPVQLNIS